MSKDPNYRENADRAVYLTGDVGEPLIQRLIPSITKLRLACSDPITVFIDSAGGSVYHGKQILSLLRSPTQDARICRIITVATTQACSAAATLLAAGDYAIAYPDAVVMHHGSRIAGERDITTEKASSLADWLGSMSEREALELAEKVFHRLCLLHIFFRSQYKDLDETNPAIERRLAALIRKNLSDTNRELVSTSLAHLDGLQDLVRHVFQVHKAELPGDDRPWGEVEISLLKIILDYEAQRNDLSVWNLSGGGFSAVRRDFFLISSFLGDFNRGLNEKIRLWGKHFLGELEARAVAETSGEKEKTALIYQHAMPPIRQLWLFTVMLCRELQRKDFFFGATEAYWLGLVDEVVGSELPNQRMMVEAP